MIHFPKSAAEAAALSGPGAELRAGGTDWLERHELGLTGATTVDLRDVKDLSDVSATAEGLRIGSKVTLRELIAHAALAPYPALTQAAQALATPQIRALASLGGALAQRVRCWYFRSVEHRCLKSGGDVCHARAGDHLLHVCFDTAPCVAPHPSTVGMALMTYDAEVEVLTAAGTKRVPIADYLASSEGLVTAVHLPPPLPNERGGYFRAISRAAAEWPLVEVSVRLVRDADVVRFVRIALGGVAPTPLRVPRAEAALEGASVDAFARAGAIAAEGARPLPMTAYKVGMIPGTVMETLARAWGDR